MFTKTLALMACAALGLWGAPALADTGQTYAEDANGVPSTAAANAASIGNGAHGAVLTAHATGGLAGADLYQYLTITIPGGGSYSLSPGQLITIPLTITYSATASIGSGPDFAQARNEIDVNSFDGANFTFVQDCETDSTSGCGATGLVTAKYDFAYAYESYGGTTTIAPSIELHLTAYASGNGADAWLDPVIAFDPTGTNANLFTGLTVTNPPASVQTTVSPVPEPAAWTMMVLGLGGLGGALRSRRRLVGSAA